MEIRQITYAQTKPFLLNIHYARRMPCVQYAFGLFDDKKELIGVCTYGIPASPALCVGVAGKENKEKVLELNRLAIKPDSPKNSASMLVGKSLKMLPKGLFIVSYADAEGWGHVGYVYQATNWIYTGMTKRRTDIFSTGHSRHYSKTETKRQIRTAKHRYIYLTGDKRERKAQLLALKYPIIKEYPKGDSRHYDINNPIPADEELIAEKTKKENMYCGRDLWD